MTRELANPLRDPRATVDYLMRLPDLSPADRPSLEMTELAVRAILQPAAPEWIATRILALLGTYPDKPQPDGVREMQFEDWMTALEGHPQWAIENACRWWKSHDNPDRRWRPVEGDIVARVRKEVRGVPVLMRFLRTLEELGK